MESDNILIAEFMGGEWIHEGEWCKRFMFTNKPGYAYFPSALLYHESWDWLMPVVEKINNLGFTIAINLQSVRPMCDTSIFSMQLPEMIGYEDKSSINATIKAVTEFIKWYKPTI
ncbi:MAG: hypothetical protein QOA70_06900 [Nitrososphaeraceae archaeon]|nr:hypothetical protein [Nitrososphaeraceae archaeon]